jgi:hypothetical protein
VGLVVGKGLGLMRIDVLCVGRALLVTAAASIACAAEPQKPTLTIALDDGWQSRMLKSELTRDWTRPNPAIKLSRTQKKDMHARGTQLNAIATKIEDYFRIVYVGPDDVPLSVRFHLPAVRINRGAWEPLDRRAFVFDGRPLVTLDWYRTRHASIARDAPRTPGGDYWAYCSEEGWSGSESVETPAPWDRTNSFPSYE